MFKNIKIILLLIFFYIVFPVSTISATTIARPMSNSGLVGYWSFEEGKGNTKTYDRSGKGNTGTLTNMNTSTAWARGATTTGQALSFDGTDDYVAVSQGGRFAITGGPFSICSWVLDDTAVATLTSLAHRIVSWYDGSKNIQLSISGNSGNRLFLLFNSSSSGPPQVVSSGNLSNGFNHVCATFDGSSTYHIYVNGVNKDGGTNANPTVFTANSTTLYIGQRGDNAAFLNGKIDELRIYNRTLSSDEVSRLYKIQKPKVVSGINNSGLVGYWPLDEATGTRAVDASFNDNTGTLTNGPTRIDGKLNGAVSFDGTNDYIDLGSDSSIDDLQTYTYSAWIYPKSFGDSSFGRIIDKTQGLNGPTWFLCGSVAGTCTGNNSLRFTQTFSGSLASWNANGSLIELNKWQHVVITYDNRSTTNDPVFYVNGSVTGTTETVAPSGTVSSDAANILTIGDRSALDRSFNGYMDDIRIYNRILSADEVKALYTGSKATVVNKSNSNRLTNGLVGYWTFDGNKTYGTKTYDSTTNGNTGTLTNSPVAVSGKLGQAFDFDGSNDYVSIADSNSLDTTSDLTISLWEKANNWTGQGGNSYATLVKKNGNYLLRKDTISSNGGSGLKLYWWDGTNYDVLKVTTPSAGVWHHIVGVAENNTVRGIYVDGVLQSGSTFANNTSSTRDLTNILEIGSGVSGTESFAGKIDDVRVYTRALSSDEIKALYNMGK